MKNLILVKLQLFSYQMYIFFSKIFLKRNHSTFLAFLLHGTSTFHKILSFWQPGYRWKVWQEGQTVCEYCAERKLLQRQMIHFITLKSTKSFYIFDLLRLCFHFGRVSSHFYSQFLKLICVQINKLFIHT